MEAIEIKIAGFLAQVKKYQNSLSSIMHFFQPTGDITDLIMNNLITHKKKGLTAYKNSIFNSIYFFIKNVKNTTPPPDIFQNQINLVLSILLVILTQRLFTIGKLDILETDNPPVNSYQDLTELDFKHVITNIKNLISENRNLRINPYIKNIFHHVTELNEINKEYTTLASHLDKKQKNVFFNNYLRIKKNVEHSIKHNYLLFLNNPESGDVKTNAILQKVSLNEFTPILNVELEQLIKIYITMCYAAEKADVLGRIIYPLIVEIQNMRELVKKETAIIRKYLITTTDDTKKINMQILLFNKAFSKEILDNLRKVHD